MAQYIALAASIMSALGPTMDKNGSGSIGRLNREGAGSAGFSTGIALGLGLGVILLSQFQKRRIKERTRYLFMTWLNDDSVNEEGEDSEKSPKKFQHIDPVTLGEDSVLQIIANCNNTMSPNLHCSKITLKKGTRTVTQHSKGVEVYYILHGTADFTLNDNKNSVDVNESILIPPWTYRTISNNSKDKVIFLRVSDAGDEESTNNADLIVEKIGKKTTFQAMKHQFKNLVTTKSTEES